MNTFQAGQTYQTRSICDSECIIRVTIASRTAKTVKTAEGKTFRIGVWHDQSGEFIKPWGSYSMAPFIKA